MELKMKFLDVLPTQPSWSVLDSSKLTTYMSCPRKYFFRYVLGWTSEYPNNHLVFGSAWHIALEHLIKNGYAKDSYLQAVDLFMQYYRQHFPPDTDELFAPKTPDNFVRSLLLYWQTFRHDPDQYALLHTETAGIVSISPTRTMTFKCDAILHDEYGTIIGLDYKTSQRRFPDWIDHWSLSTQMLTYLHAIKCMYPMGQLHQMLIRTAFFYKQDRKGENKPTIFEEYAIEKSDAQMDSWLARTNTWAIALESDMGGLIHDDDTEDATLLAFPQNDTACFNYGRKCEYFDYCTAWSNPLTRCEEPPIGFNVTWWDPLAAPEIKERVNLITSYDSENNDE